MRIGWNVRQPDRIAANRNRQRELVLGHIPLRVLEMLPVLAVLAEEGPIPVARRSRRRLVVVFTLEGGEVKREFAPRHIVHAEIKPRGLAVAPARVLLATDVQAKLRLAQFFNQSNRAAFEGGVEENGFRGGLRHGRGRGRRILSPRAWAQAANENEQRQKEAHGRKVSWSGNH